MSRQDDHRVEIYIGAPVEHASERAILDRLVHLLSAARRPAIVLANISIKGRQIDTIAATDSLVLVVEAKGSSRAVRGGENGPWQVRVASGQWKDFRNPYIQTRDAALAIRDAMRSFGGTEVPYPAAALVFVPGISPNSEPYAGDFKVSVVGLDGLEATLGRQQQGAWPMERWRAFAEHLRLTPVASPAAACDETLAEAEALLRQYAASYCRTYTHPETVVPFPCRSGGEMVSSDEIVQLVAERRADILVQGPSGCGKTLVGAQAARAFTERGGIAITIPVRIYAGSLKTVLNQEAGLLSGTPARTLLDAARRMNRPLLFVVDGYNECAPSEQPSLSRGLAALARNYEASLLITSQGPLARADLLALRTIEVLPATSATKAAITLNATGGDVLPHLLQPLLDAITTGLEARLIGEVGQEMSGGSSRFALFDAFARKRLGDVASDGIRLLSGVAGWLSERVAFSLSVRDLDRLTDKSGLSHTLGQRLQAAGLLAQRGDRVSFTHEMFFDAFAAENVVRRTAGRATGVLTALASPQHSGRKAFILGAIDDDLLRDRVLARVDDGDSIAACLAGACGHAAREWAEERSTALWGRLRAEALGVQCRISGEGWSSVTFEKASLATWTSSECAFLAAMPRQLFEGRYLDEALDVVGILDRRIADEAVRLRDEARKRNVALQSALFKNAYVISSQAPPGIGRICMASHGGFFRKSRDAVAQDVERRLEGDDLSAGQIFLLLMLSRGAGIAAPLFAKLIERCWASAPYHLRLDLMDSARMCRRSGERERAALIAAIEALPQPGHPFISTAVVEALQSLGALEKSEREHVATVREEVKECLADPEDTDRCAMAYGVFSAQFDHPYSAAYCEVIAGLPKGEQKMLLTMAAKGAEDTAFFLVPLLVELTSFGDPSIGDRIARWTAPPAIDSFMPQESIAAFVVTHIALARLGCSLPNAQALPNRLSAEALVACGKVLYWCNRTDLDETTRRSACDAGLQVLLRHAHAAALDVIRHCECVLVEGLEHLPGDTPIERSIVRRFPAVAAEICRHALAEPESQVGYF